MVTPKLKLTIQIACDETALPERAVIRRWLQSALSRPAVFTVRFVSSEESAELNTYYRKKASSTNVLTFPYSEKPVCEADLALCPSVIEREAKEQHKTLEAHYAHMIIHGALHAQGYDHITDEEAAEMESIERQILQSLGFDDPYRNEACC